MSTCEGGHSPPSWDQQDRGELGRLLYFCCGVVGISNTIPSQPSLSSSCQAALALVASVLAHHSHSLLLDSSIPDMLTQPGQAAQRQASQGEEGTVSLGLCGALGQGWTRLFITQTTALNMKVLLWSRAWGSEPRPSWAL